MVRDAGELYSSKKPYGNKTPLLPVTPECLLYSSKKPYGNKTDRENGFQARTLYSSKKPYGNKTSNIIALLLIFD